MIAGGATIVAVAFALMGLLAPLQNIWLAVLPCTILLGLGMSGVVSPLSTAVMTSVEDRDTGLASGVNNAVARVAGLLAVALMGGVAAFVFERALGSAAELPLFFGMQPADVPAARHRGGADRRQQRGLRDHSLLQRRAGAALGGHRLVHPGSKGEGPLVLRTRPSSAWRRGPSGRGSARWSAGRPRRTGRSATCRAAASR